VDGELVNPYVVVARMHGWAANWVPARYANRGDATPALDWLAGHLEAWHVDLVAAASEPNATATSAKTPE